MAQGFSSVASPATAFPSPNPPQFISRLCSKAGAKGGPDAGDVERGSDVRVSEYPGGAVSGGAEKRG